MKNKVKEFIKSYLPGFILGVISAAVVVVYAETYFPSNQVTYDNSSSGLSSSNVQGAIDELYNTCFPPTAGDQIIENAGLEKDPYECRYFFTGANPNNYITFNGEDAGWRIISVECDGKIKIIKIDSIGGYIAWDESNNNNWARPATLNTYLNSTYYNRLNSTARGQIVASNFSIGAVSLDINMDMSTQVSKENLEKWEGKIALPTVSEYIRTNSNKSSCGTFSSYEDNFGSCKNTTWMYNSNIDHWWTLTPNSYPGHSYNHVFYLYSGGYSGGFINSGDNDTVNKGFAVVRPTLYLSSDIQITGGDGGQSNPYTLG